MKSKIRVFAEDHASEILTGVGVVGTAGVAVGVASGTTGAGQYV